MKRNDKLINSLAKVAARNRAVNVALASDEMVPQMYAAMAIALKQEYGFGFERIDRVFKASQTIWEDFVSKGMSGCDMAKLCEEMTGIKVIGEDMDDKHRTES